MKMCLWRKLAGFRVRIQRSNMKINIYELSRLQGRLWCDGLPAQLSCRRSERLLVSGFRRIEVVTVERLVEAGEAVQAADPAAELDHSLHVVLMHLMPPRNNIKHSKKQFWRNMRTWKYQKYQTMKYENLFRSYKPKNDEKIWNVSKLSIFGRTLAKHRPTFGQHLTFD